MKPVTASSTFTKRIHTNAWKVLFGEIVWVIFEENQIRCQFLVQMHVESIVGRDHFKTNNVSGLSGSKSGQDLAFKVFTSRTTLKLLEYSSCMSNTVRLKELNYTFILNR